MSLEAIQFQLRSNQDELRRYNESMVKSRTRPNAGKLQLYNNNIARLKSELARSKAATSGPTPRFKSRGRSRGKQGGSKKRRSSRKRRGSRKRR